MSQTIEAEDRLSANEQNILTDHSYDGIQEFDNPLPGWWKFLFWVTILFSPVYYLYFHAGGDGRSIHDEYTRHMDKIFQLRFAGIGDLEADRETILKYTFDEPEWQAVGQVVFEMHCASCHKKDGSGGVGPNLTDDHWKNVKNIEDIAKIISEGAANGAMPAWQNRLSHQNQVVLTAAYVAAMRANPVAGKAPEGEEIGPWDSQ